MNKRAHSHVSMTIDLIEDTELILNLSHSANKTRNSPSRSTISNYANLEVANNNNITLVNVSSSRLKAFQ